MASARSVNVVAGGLVRTATDKRGMEKALNSYRLVAHLGGNPAAIIVSTDMNRDRRVLPTIVAQL